MLLRFEGKWGTNVAAGFWFDMVGKNEDDIYWGAFLDGVWKWCAAAPTRWMELPCEEVRDDDVKNSVNWEPSTFCKKFLKQTSEN